MSRCRVTAPCGAALEGASDDACKLNFRAHYRACAECQAAPDRTVGQVYAMPARTIPLETARPIVAPDLPATPEEFVGRVALTFPMSAVEFAALDPYGADAFAFPGPGGGVGYALNPAEIAAARAEHADRLAMMRP